MTFNRRRTLAHALGAILVVAGCGDLEPVAPHEAITDPEQLYMRLTLDHPAITMSTAAGHNTLQLTATPRNALGAPITGLSAPTFRSSDTTRVRVSPEGLLQAIKAGSRILVIAELTAEGNVRHVDTARVNVTTKPTPPELATFSITPAPPDSAIWSALPPLGAIYGYLLLLFAAGIDVIGVGGTSSHLRALDTDGNPIPELAISYESLDASIAVVDRENGVPTVYRPGQVRIVARTMAYGISKSDTAVFTVKMPVINGVWIQPGANNPQVFAPSEVTIRTNGFVFWTNLLDLEESDIEPAAVDVTFDDPTNVAAIAPLCSALGDDHCDAGNIIAPLAGSDAIFLTRGRQFPVPGVYTYRSTVTGATGRVIVTDGAAP